MKRFLVIALLANFALADVNIKIEPKENYGDYAIPNLRKRVWQLEKAVADLQKKMELMQSKQAGGFKCQMTSFGKTFTAIDENESKAKSLVVRDCTEANTVVHCKEDLVKCEDRNAKK